MKTVQQITFVDIFKYAEKYGIGWNEANNVFFHNNLEYGSVTNLYGGDDWRGYTDMWNDDNPRDALDYTVEEVQAMCKRDQAYLIAGAYLNEHKIEGEVQVDCR